MSDPLKKLDKAATLLDEAYARGVADERARVVADLTGMAETMKGQQFAWRDALEWAAARYERGEHEEAT